jgi:carbamate kinase
MSGTVVVLVNGEVLANGQGSRIADQRKNAMKLSEGLLPLFLSDHKVLVLHGNKPQVGFVLFRSELASHVLHGIPLDVCGADTQGATGYMLSQSFTNVLRNAKKSRKVISVITQTMVDNSTIGEPILKAIGPRFDREKAEQYRQSKGWTMIEEPGRGYRRAVPSLPPKEILEFEGINHMVEKGMIVIAGGGGGVPVIQNSKGELEGIEAVLDTEKVAVLLAHQMKAKILLSVIENDNKFILSGISTEKTNHLSLEALDEFIATEKFTSTTVENKLRAASDFLHGGGDQVIITTLRKLPDVLSLGGGLRIDAPHLNKEILFISDED